MKTDMCISMCFKLLLSVDLESVGLEGFIEYVQTLYRILWSKITDKMTIKFSGRNIFREGIFDHFYFYEVTKRLF